MLPIQLNYFFDIVRNVLFSRDIVLVWYFVYILKRYLVNWQSCKIV